MFLGGTYEYKQVYTKDHSCHQRGPGRGDYKAQQSGGAGASLVRPDHPRGGSYSQDFKKNGP